MLVLQHLAHKDSTPKKRKKKRTTLCKEVYRKHQYWTFLNLMLKSSPERLLVPKNGSGVLSMRHRKIATATNKVLQKTSE